MAVITKQELEDAAADAFALEKVVNGSPTEGGTGIVSTRLGQQIKTLAKVILDLSTTDIGTSAQAAINRYIVEGTASQSGPARALIGNSTTPALSRGTYTTGNNGYLATVTGWRCAFKHNGSNFDTAQLTFKTITSAADVVVEIYSTDGTTILAKGLAKGTTTLKTHTVMFDRVVSGIAADTILYIAYRTVNRTVQVSYPGGGTYESGVDNAVYREAYTQAAENTWVPVDNPSAPTYLIPFRFFNLSTFSRSLVDELTLLNTQVGGAAGKTNAWPDPYFRRYKLADANNFLSKNRWWGGNLSAWSMIPNPVYNGQALQRLATAQASPLCGPVLYLDEIGAAAGDVVTVRALVTGNGAVAGIYGREDSGEDAAWTGGQQSFVKADGTGATGTTSSTPVLMTLQFTVSTGTKRLALYSNHSGSPGQTFNVVALWGFKGAAADGPPTPSVLDEIQTYNNFQARLTQAENSLAPTVAGVQYVTEAVSEVQATSKVTTLAGSGTNTTPRALVFTGWGERYLANNVSFNALRIVTIGRSSTSDTDKWRTLYVFVRSGTNSHAGGTLLAVGQATVQTANDILNGVEFVLKDPITGAVKTLTDADLITPSNPTGEYFIGVYAKNKTGGWAACGEPNGTLPNTQGNSYYLTSSFTSPETQQWMVHASNARQCFEHFVATNPVQAFVFKPTDEFANDLAAQLGEVPPELILPPAVYGVQGREFNLYFDNVVVGSAWDYNVDVNSVGSVGYHLDECWRWTPTGAVTTGDLTVSLSGRASGKQLVSGVTAQRSAASSAGSGTNKKIVYIGDSLINAGVITQTLLDIAATDVMGVTLYGLRGSGANKHEGRGGWSIPDYSTYGRTAYQFTVSGLTTVPTNGATYTHNGSTYTVEWTNITSGSGTITAFLTTGTATPLTTGTLTKTGGTGDSSITFAASAAVSGNPFWIGGQVNFAGYLSAFGFPAPDWVFIALGINDVFGQSSDAAAASLAQSRFLQLETLITSIKAANANTRVGIVIPTPPTSSQDAFGFNYTTGQTRWRNKRNVLIWGRELIAKFQNREADRIYVVPSNTALDTVNNYDRSAAAPVNSRATSVLVSRQNNGVHPGATGYQQIGDAVWAFLKYFA